MIFNRSQNWISSKYTYDYLKDIIIEKFNIKYGFPPHYSQIHTIYAIINTGNPYSILTALNDAELMSKVLNTDSSIFHLFNTKHGRNKLRITHKGKSTNIFLNKSVETVYIDLAIDCSVYVISTEIENDLIKFMLLKAVCDDNFIVDDILTTIGMTFIVVHFKGKNEICKNYEKIPVTARYAYQNT